MGFMQFTKEREAVEVAPHSPQCQARINHKYECDTRRVREIVWIHMNFPAHGIAI